MREILVVNPLANKSAAKRGRKGQTTMAKKRKKSAKPAGKRKKYRRKNPAGRARRAASAVGGRLLGGLGIKQALKDQFALQAGMLAAQFAAKRFGPDANELDATTWNWGSYAKGLAGAVVAGMAANALKPGSGRLVMLGGITHIVHRLVRNQLIEKSEWGIRNFGQAEADEGQMLVDESGNPYLNNGGQYLPLDERHRAAGYLPDGSSMGDSLVEAGPLGELVPVGRLGGNNDMAAYAQAYR